MGAKEIPLNTEEPQKKKKKKEMQEATRKFW